MEVTRYFIEKEIDEPKCIVCGTRIEVDEVSYELRFDKDHWVTKEDNEKIWCQKCLPREAIVYKGTQTYSSPDHRKNLKGGIK